MVHGPAPARAGGRVFRGQRAPCLARLAHWGRYGALWTAVDRYGPLGPLGRARQSEAKRTQPIIHSLPRGFCENEASPEK